MIPVTRGRRADHHCNAEPDLAGSRAPDTGGPDRREVEQARFVLDACISALASTNTRLGSPAALKLEIVGKNALAHPGAMRVLGTPVHLSRITVPTFVTGALTDHLTPWHGCYRTTQLLSGPTTFVLSSSGHIQSLVNPLGNPRASYWTGGEPGPDPHAWRAAATKHTGSWWEPWVEWMLERSGEEIPAPTAVGSAIRPAREPAPGTYVVERRPG